MKRIIGPVALAAALATGLSACTNPYDPGQRALGGAALGAGTGAAIGGIAGGGRGAAIGAGAGCAPRRVTGAARSAQSRGQRRRPRRPRPIMGARATDTVAATAEGITPRPRPSPSTTR